MLLPLYPQYSKTTTGSSVNEWARNSRPRRWRQIPSRLIESYHDHPTYIGASVDLINQTLEKFSRPEEVHLVFSAHGVPTAVIDAGRPVSETGGGDVAAGDGARRMETASHGLLPKPGGLRPLAAAFDP